MFFVNIWIHLIILWHLMLGTVAVIGPIIYNPLQMPGMPNTMLGSMSAPMPAPMPASMSFPMSPSMPVHLPAPMAVPLPMPSSGPLQMHPPKMPVVVMPYRSKATDRKFRRKRRRRPKYFSDHSDSYTDSSSCSDSSDSAQYNFRGSRIHRSRGKKRRQVLSPVISYITRTGRVVYQKKIKKDNPDDWLKFGKRDPSNLNNHSKQVESSAEMTVRDLKRKYKLKKHKHKH